MLVLGPVVPTTSQPPGATGGGLELAEVKLPDLVRTGRLVGECGLPPLGEFATFALVVRGQNQSLVTQRAQHGRLGHDVAIVADHGPDLAVSPGRMLRGVLEDQLPMLVAGGLWPRPLDLRARAGTGLPASPGALGHVDDLAEPRGRHARLDADHLEVLEGPNLPSADFFQTRSSTAASPSA